MEKYSSNLLRLMGKIACIFGIPAFGGFFIGLFLDRYFGTERRYILITLSVSFVLSWVLLWRFYRRMKSAQATQSVGSVAGMASESGKLRYDEPGVWKSKRK
jgi:positive regulator of sigma E activity